MAGRSLSWSGPTGAPWRTGRARGGERLGTAEAVRVALEVLESLAVVHAMGLVHRDVKPSNVLFRSVPEHKRSGGELERVLLGDLGLAKDLTLASGFTMSAGTPAYMAPEQRGLVGMVDARADLYAVAVVLSELIVGQGRSSAGTTVGGQGTAVVADVGTRARLASWTLSNAPWLPTPQPGSPPPERWPRRYGRALAAPELARPTTVNGQWPFADGGRSERCSGISRSGAVRFQASGDKVPPPSHSRQFHRAGRPVG